MLKRVVISGLFFCFFALIYSCSGGGEHKEKIAKIDSLISEVDKTSDLLASINYDTMSHVNSIYWQANNEIARVAVIKPSKEDMAVLQMFGQCKKPFRRYIESKAGSEKELLYTKKQLEDLKSSILKNQIAKDSIDSYVLIEETAAMDVVMDVNKMVSKLKEQKAAYDTLYPRVVKIIQDLDAKLKANPELKNL